MTRRVPKATDIQFTKKDIRKAATRPTLPHGLHYFVHTDGKVEIQENGDYSGTMKFTTRVAALKDPEDSNSKVRPQMRDGFWFPFNNPEVPGHRAPEWASGLAYQYLNACFEEEIPDMPKKDEEGNLVFKGELVCEAGDEAMGVVEQEKRDEVMEAVYDKCLELLDNPGLIKQGAFFGEVGLDRKKKQYTNVLSRWHTIPEDMELVDWAAIEEEEAEEAPAPKKAAKKARKRR